MTLLETKGLTVTYGGLNANDNIDITVEPGKLTGLIGPNGAGKTTFIDAITGFTKPSAGTIDFDGTEINDVSPNARAHLGLSRTFQSLELFEDLTVRDNLLVAAERPKWYSTIVDVFHPGRADAALQEQVEWALDIIGLEKVADRLPSDLSHGQRKLVGVSRALASRPKLILLDEPAAGLDTTESQVLGSHLRQFLTRDITVFLIEVAAVEMIAFLPPVLLALWPPRALRRAWKVSPMVAASAFIAAMAMSLVSAQLLLEHSEIAARVWSPRQLASRE